MCDAASRGFSATALLTCCLYQWHAGFHVMPKTGSRKAILHGARAESEFRLSTGFRGDCDFSTVCHRLETKCSVRLNTGSDWRLPVPLVPIGNRRQWASERGARPVIIQSCWVLDKTQASQFSLCHVCMLAVRVNSAGTRVRFSTVTRRSAHGADAYWLLVMQS